MKNIFTALFLCAFALLVPAVSAQADDAQAGDLVISDVWSRATPKSARTGALFLTIRNLGTQADRLVAIETPAADKGELHTMVMENGIMKMRPLAKGIPVGPKATVELKPGGLHGMLIGLKGPLIEGTSVHVTATFEKAGKVKLMVPVRALVKKMDHSMPEPAAAPHGNMKNMGMDDSMKGDNKTMPAQAQGKDKGKKKGHNK